MKILIIGIVASGKTTLAKRLSSELGIDHYEIDSIVHDDLKKIKRSDDEQNKIIDDIDKNKNWILEGTLRRNLYSLLEKADRIIYIDIPLCVRKKRIITRYIKQKFRIEQCNYKPSLEMVKRMFEWTKDFDKNRRVILENELIKYDDKLVVLNSVKEVENYSIKEN